MDILVKFIHEARSPRWVTYSFPLPLSGLLNPAKGFRGALWGIWASSPTIENDILMHFAPREPVWWLQNVVLFLTNVVIYECTLCYRV